MTPVVAIYHQWKRAQAEVQELKQNPWHKKKKKLKFPSNLQQEQQLN